MANTETEEYIQMLLKKAQEKDKDAKPHEPAEINIEKIEKITEALKKELASKKK